MAGPQKLNDNSALLKDRDDQEVAYKRIAYNTDVWLHFYMLVIRIIMQVPTSTDFDEKDPLFPRLSKEQLELISRCEVIGLNTESSAKS